MAPFDAPDFPEREALQHLTARARGRFGAIPAETIAQHVLVVTRGADFAVSTAALEALLRRFEGGRRDGLRVKTRPRQGRVLGPYLTARTQAGKSSKRDRPHASGVRPHSTELASIEPPSGSCSCPDFVRSGLGLCKHLLVVLADAHRPRRLASARTEQTRAATDGAARLRWDFMEPLRGDSDRLARLRWEAPRAGRAQKPPAGFALGRPDARVLADPRRRLQLIEALQGVLGRGGVLAEPATWTVLEEEAARARRRGACESGAAAALRSLSGLERKLYGYQREGVRRFLHTGRLLLADDMGLGKTTQAIAACHALFRCGAVQRGLLVVPAALKSQWQREWQETTETPLALVEGSPAERARQYRAHRRGFLAIGYEQLLRDFEHVQRLAPQLVVLDEAQRIKNWATKSAAYVKALTPAYRLVLTGTPMENRLDELASIVDFVDDVALEPKWRLVPFHTIATGDGGPGQHGARNLDVLRRRLSGCMLRRVRSEVLSQLPSRTDTRVPVELTAAQSEEHEALRQPIATLARTARRRPLTQPEFLRLMQLLTTQRMICNGLAQLRFDDAWPMCSQAKTPTPALLDGLFSPKLGALRGLLEQVVVAQRRKVVVFSQWRNMLRLAEWSVRDLLHAAGLRAVFFTGAESQAQRTRAIVDLHDDPSAAVMFLSDAGGVGLNLQRAANCCINLELPWNPAVLEQRIGRIHRLGQKHPIDVYNLVSEGGIESRIAALVGRKKALFTSLFDGTSDEVKFEGNGSFIEGVERLIEPATVPVLAKGVDLAAEDEDPVTLSHDERAPNQMPPGQPGVSDIRDEAGLGTALSKLSISRLPDGGLRLDAPSELAAPLATLLEGLARQLRGSAQGG